MLFTTMKAAYLFGEENTVHLLCTLDDLVRLDLLNVVIREREQIFCVEKYSYKARDSMMPFQPNWPEKSLKSQIRG